MGSVSCLFVVVIAGCILSSAVNAAKQPNIILLLTDDQDVLMGSLNYMPKLHKLVTTQGAFLENYFIATPVCCPSRASILRGQYSHNTGIIDLAPPNGGSQRFHNLGRDNSTIGVWLHEAGYNTAFIGKYLNAYPCNQSYAHTVPPGWTDWFALCDPGVYNYYHSIYSNNGVIEHRPNEYQTETIGAKAVNFIQRSVKQDKPFFIYLSGCAPHQPATPAHKYANLFPNVKAPRKPSYNQTSTKNMGGFLPQMPYLSAQQEQNMDNLYRNRLRALQSVDDNVELLINTLESMGVLDNTYLFYTADNGFHLGEHRMPAGKREPYEEDIKVPFIVRGPGIAANITLTLNAQNIDIGPTIADLAGAKTPDFVDGKSIAPFLLNKHSREAQDAFRPIVLIEHWGLAESQPVFMNNTWQELKMLNSTENTKYTSWCGRSSHEIFDVLADPYELTNKFDDTPRTQAVEYDQVLQGYFRCASATCRDLSFEKGANTNLQPLTECEVDQ